MRTKEIKSMLLKKGWAGRTISREDTVLRLNPLLALQIALGRLYDHADRFTADAGALEALQRNLRLDSVKLAETIFSCGGVAYSKADRTEVTDDGLALLGRITAQERAFQEALLKERSVDHQMRTEAVLRHCMNSSKERLGFLNRCAREFRSTR